MPSDATRHAPPKRKSLLAAFLLWFFLGIFAAHKFYLGKRRQGVLLLLAYFLLPLAVAVAAALAMQAYGKPLVPPGPGAGGLRALAREGRVLALAGAALAVLAALWVGDFIVLVRQVREHNAAAEAASGEASPGAEKEPQNVP